MHRRIYITAFCLMCGAALGAKDTGGYKPGDPPPPPPKGSKQDKAVEKSSQKVDGANQNFAAKPGDAGAIEQFNNANGALMQSQAAFAQAAKDGEIEEEEALLMSAVRAQQYIQSTNSMMEKRFKDKSSKPSKTTPVGAPVSAPGGLAIPDPISDSGGTPSAPTFVIQSGGGRSIASDTSSDDGVAVGAIPIPSDLNVPHDSNKLLVKESAPSASIVSSAPTMEEKADRTDDILNAAQQSLQAGAAQPRVSSEDPSEVDSASSVRKAVLRRALALLIGINSSDSEDSEEDSVSPPLQSDATDLPSLGVLPTTKHSDETNSKTLFSKKERAEADHQARVIAGERSGSFRLSALQSAVDLVRKYFSNDDKSEASALQASSGGEKYLPLVLLLAAIALVVTAFRFLLIHRRKRRKNG